MLSDDLAYTSVSELASQIRQRKLSPVEVMDATIARIEEHNPGINAIVFEDFDWARDRAVQAERAVMADQPLGILHGVPTAIKDLFDSRPGWPASYGGVRALKDHVVDYACAFAERVEKAGAIPVGKTNSPTMGFRGTCDNYLFGPSRNPFNVELNTGGSSGGSAAAVASGLLTFAEGTDGGGSIRIPASWCGLYGFKASYGRVPFLSRPNAFAGSTPFLFEGALTRSVEDAALVTTALAGFDDRDPFSLRDSPDYLSAVQQDIRGLRIAYSPDFDVFPVDPAVADVVGRAVGAFEEVGARVERVRLGIRRDQSELSSTWARLIMPVNMQILEDLKRSGPDLLRDHAQDFPPEFLHWAEISASMTVLDWYRDQEIRTEVYDAVQGILREYDLLATPTLACLPVRNVEDGNTLGPAEVRGVAVDRLIGWCLTYPINFTGHPAASIPAGLSDDGLPVGLQLIGRTGADTSVLRASGAFERARPWQHHYRHVWA